MTSEKISYGDKKNGFQLSVESNDIRVCLVFALPLTLCDWPVKLAPLSQPMS